ncbi:MAG: hypothetical protein QM723_22530 [Myxococcaceae bacterium]
MKLRWPAHAVAVAFVLSLACSSAPNLPGDEAMGTFEFHATPVSQDCALGSIPDGGFDFEVIARHNKSGDGAWLLIGGIVGDAGFDGQYVTSVRTAPRAFLQADGGSCNPQVTDGGAITCSMTLTETLTFALLSESQFQAVGNHCPDNPLDGGVPQPGADSGVTRPGSVGGGTSYDAVEACGTLVDVASIDGGCNAACLVPCTLTYQVSGARK